jgi:chemotaxis response regulator CheB/two-component sensor histidine kinase
MDEQTKNASVSDRPLPPLAHNDSAANDGQATANSTTFYVAGVGASAGGLEALEAFFGQMPPNSGLAFVVIQHLSPDFKSLMDELLSRRTEIAVRRVEDGMLVGPNTIYLMPPRKEMIVSGGRLLLTDKDPATALSLPIDTFFRSLAQDFGERAIGIVLSGTGSDGSRGIRAIHEAGGLVISQSEETAKFDGMPRSANDTGVVDLVLPPAAMAEALVNYIKPALHGVKKKPASEKLAAEDGMNAVFSLLRAECGIDFSHYKPNTVLRRIDRRLQLNRSLHLDEYDVSRVTQGKIHIRSEVVDLRAIAEEAVQVAQPLMARHRHTLILNLSEQPIYVEGDAARLLQVQENLLENAAKYTPSGGTIRLSLHVDDGEAVLQVKDNGVGIAPEMQSKIFDLFVQAPQAPGRNDAGMGIGLTLVRSIVELHQGHIAVHSDGLNQGSEFEVRLPLTEKVPATRDAPAPAPEAGVKVLIVEDNADNREILLSLLRIDGYNVQAAPDGLRGYAAIVADRPDVALVDIELPGINGYQLAQKVRTELGDRSIRLVALTGYGRSVDREAVFAAGFNEHLVKPVDPEDLSRVLRKPR